MSTTHLQHLPEWRLKKVDLSKLEALQRELQLPLAISKALSSMDFDSLEQIQEFLNPNLKLWHSNASFPSLDAGAKALFQAISNKDRICIHGDFDTDGMLATLVLKDLLQKIGANHFCLIPTRNDGHGLSINSVQKAIDAGAQWIVSVDCGINATKETDFANQHGVNVIITDHHLPDEILPNAVAIVNPQLDDFAEFKILSGTGVALKLALAVLGIYESAPLSTKTFETYLNQSLVITAIATVADVMELKGINRALVQHALRNFDSVQNPGLLELIKLAKLKSPASAEDLSFQLIPRINSAQRMERGELIWELLNCVDTTQAVELGKQLEQLNVERKALLEQHTKEVMAQLQLQNFDASTAIMVTGDDWLEGFSGLIAQRVIQKYQRPAIVMLKKSDTKIVASCRSPEGWHLKQALDQCAHLLEESGGHAQAAGFRTHPDHLEALKLHLNQCLRKQAESLNEGPKLLILHELPFRDLNVSLFESLKILEPHGQGNTKPIFATKGIMFDGPLRFMGKDQTHVGFEIFQPGLPSVSAIAFGMGMHFQELDQSGKYDLAYTLTISPYKRQLQLQVQGIRPHQTPTVYRSQKISSNN